MCLRMIMIKLRKPVIILVKLRFLASLSQDHRKKRDLPRWWPRTSGGRLRFARNYAFVVTQLRPFCKRKQKKHLQKKIDHIFCLGSKDKQFYQLTLIPAPLQFRGITIFQTQIIKYRNKHEQIAVLLFFYHKNL